MEWLITVLVRIKKDCNNKKLSINYTIKRCNESINSEPEYYYDDDEFDCVNHSGTDYDVQVAAIAYMYGISKQKAIKKLSDELTDSEIEKAVSYYFDKDLPPFERTRRCKERMWGVYDNEKIEN